jgi:LPS-assembly protein
MLRRLFLFFLPTLTASVSYANQASWNCEQNKDSKEWVCIGEQKQTAKTSEAAPPARRESVKAIQPALTNPAEKTHPVKATSAQVTEPVKPVSAKPAQPVITEPVRMAPTVTAKSVASTQPTQPLAVQGNKSQVTQSVKNIRPAVPAFQTPAPNISVPVESPQSVMPQAVRVSPPVAIQPVQPVLQKPSVNNSKNPGEEVRRSGWNCDASGKDENWNCQLVGSDPQGKAEAVVTNNSSWRLLTPAFDHQQEQIFSTLTSQMKYDPWANCSVETGTKRDFVPEADQRDTSPLDVKSNYAEVFDNEIGSYSGNVKMTRADQNASSNAANYDSVSEVLDLHGNVYYSEDELALSSESATLKLAADQAKLREVQFITPSPLRGRAEAVYRDSKTFSRYKNVAFTSCRPGNQDWIAHASELKMNKTSGRGSTKNTWIEFKGVPVFYSPYLSFPIDNRRISGFLAPAFSSTQQSGFNISAPYYWNIAPNYDATIIPHYLTDRGALLTGKFRYLTEYASGKVGVEVMPDDSQTHTTRYLGSIKNFSQITPNINSNLDLNYVSDRTYFSELGNSLSFANFNYLSSSANISYASQGISFVSQVQNYQSINEAIPDSALPYRKLPQINLNLDHAFKFMPLYTAMENEYVYFQHNDNVANVDGQSINFTPSGQRINTKPSVSIPLQTPGAFFTPKLSLQHTQYFLASGQPFLENNKQQIGDTSVSRTLPIFSADGGLFFERNLDIANTSYLHTLEPRLFYLYVPYTNQQDIPVFDSAAYDFSYSSMFRENSFSGTDRIQDANQITTAITSRLVDEKAGLERLKLSVGEIFYFRDRLVTIPGAPILQPTGTFSSLVTELSSQLTPHLSATSGLQWNPQLNAIQRADAALHYGNENNELFSIGYLYRNYPNTGINNLPIINLNDPLNNITQSDMSFRLPIYDNWYAIGRWQYSWLYDTTQDGLFGIEKENCCWRFRIFGRHFINNLNNINNNTATGITEITGTAQNGIFFQIELKGLTGISTKGDMDKFLQQTIYGYRKPQND